jgi:Ni/Co efflux regulator RcnB
MKGASGMKGLMMLSAAALMALAGGAAEARDDRRGPSRDWRGPPAHAQAHGLRRNNAAPQAAYRQGYRDGLRAAQDQTRWRVGDRLPPARYLVIDNHRRHGLRRPPRGQSYVQVDRDIMLVAEATGRILDILGR